MSKQKNFLKVRIAAETFNVMVKLGERKVISRDGMITNDVEITFDPRDAERLSMVMSGVKPGDFSIAFIAAETMVKYLRDRGKRGDE